MTMPSPELSFLFCAALCATVGAFLDIQTHRIPNWLTGSSLGLGLSLHLFLGGWGAMGMAALAGLVGGAIFFLLFAIGAMGAGDIKLMAAVSLIAGFGHLMEMFAAIAMVGGAFAIGLALVRRRFKSTVANVGRLIHHHAATGLLPHPELNLLNSEALRMPYAIAIAGGCWIVLASQIAMSY